MSASSSPAALRIAAVFAGGLIGTGIRLTLDLWFHDIDGVFPLSTLIVNVSGSFVLAVLVGSLWVRRGVPDWLRAGLGAGLLGSYTTFSALAAALVTQLSDGRWMLALGYLLTSLVFGLTAASAGLVLGHRIGRGREQRDWSTE